MNKLIMVMFLILILPCFMFSSSFCYNGEYNNLSEQTYISFNYYNTDNDTNIQIHVFKSEGLIYENINGTWFKQTEENEINAIFKILKLLLKSNKKCIYFE